VEDYALFITLTSRFTIRLWW